MIKNSLIAVFITLLTVGLAYHFLQSDETKMLDNAKKATVMIINVGNDPEKVTGGSGAIITEDGYVVTNYHVVSHAETLYVILSDHTLHEARLVGVSTQNDLALLKISGQKFDHFTFNEKPLRSGERVYAIGAPFFLEQTISAGILSSLKREGYIPWVHTYLIQSNVACNPGNSGGPLINRWGKLIGINQSILTSPSGNAEGFVPNTSYCFSVPDRVVKYVVEHLIAKKKINPKWIGAEYENVDYKISKETGFNKVIGVRITKVYPKTPAEKAGLKVGDIIIDYNNEEINSSDELGVEVNLAPLKQPIPALIWRDEDKSGTNLEMNLESELKPRKEQVREQLKRGLPP